MSDIQINPQALESDLNLRDDEIVDDQEELDDLSVIETATTYDTTKLEDLQRIVEDIRGVNVNEGNKLWSNIDNLPKVNGGQIGQTQTRKKALIYLNNVKLTNLDGIAVGQLKAEQKKEFKINSQNY